MFELLVELETVIPGLRTKNPSAANERPGFQTSVTGTAGTFLANNLLGAVCYFPAFLGLVGALALVCQILLDIQVERVVVGFYSKNGIV